MAVRKQKVPAVRRPPRKQKSGDSAAKKGTARRKETPLRAGMPAVDSIISQETFKSPKGRIYRILKTSEVDEYDEAAKPSGKRKRGLKRDT